MEQEKPVRKKPPQRNVMRPNPKNPFLNLKPLSVRLLGSQRILLRQIAKKHKMTMSELVRTVTFRYLTKDFPE